MDAIYLPPLWLVVLANAAVGVAFCVSEDLRNGPMLKGSRDGWSHRYTFWLEYTARTGVTGVAFLMLQTILSMAF
ncbi:hypothetical protein [Sinorhizobium meliloti]|uniref:hypothetical protein n=1 Tax=Rhizobium meliloti TaxID=382 RepID=UPI000FD781AD|nr:hypothetical protein [Sinorhizobium meliloti]MDW9473459.1 hypothetical protein [Sinorhizobium meliloti]RVI73482.1 hypothetical protein CN188_30915 [Sinorhizobium meliloti]RVP23569.1 hypothetical protein CN080_12590 [Sinorhizobium meliloti]